MTLTLTNGKATATLLPTRGGLLRDLALEDGAGRPVDLLWQADDFSEAGSGWPMGGLPVLFPFGGRVFHDGQPFRYVLGGVQRAMPLHGFGYGLPWEIVSQGPAHAELALSDNEQTQALYPFRFRLTARYELKARSLGITVTVEARGALAAEPRMPVALGLHPFFRMPLGAGSTLDGCRLETTAAGKVRVTPTGGVGKLSRFPEDDKEREALLSDTAFHNVILSDLSKPEAVVHDAGAKLAIRIGWDRPDLVRYVVLWTRAGEGFHCVEPWMGLPDATASGHGAAWLAAGESLKVGFTVGLEAGVTPRAGS